jgi:alanine transaminase
VRGPIVARAEALKQQLERDPASVPFRQVISCNIGNPHALEQKSLTYIRQVLSLVVNPSLIDEVRYPQDVIARARKYLAALPDIGEEQAACIQLSACRL